MNGNCKYIPEQARVVSPIVVHVTLFSFLSNVSKGEKTRCESVVLVSHI